jgi:hypothetical protein
MKQYRIYFQNLSMQKNQLIKTSEYFKTRKSALEYFRDINNDSIVFARLESREKGKSKIEKELK